MRRVSATNIVHDIQTYAVVSSISSASGGLKGGQQITINGRWFWPDNTKVKIGGRNCEIVSVEDEKIVCTVPMGQETDSGELYPGGRGMESFLYSGDKETNWEGMLAKDASKADAKVSMYGNMDYSNSDHSVQGGFGGIAKGFFAPMVDSDYQVGAAGDGSEMAWGRLTH